MKTVKNGTKHQVITDLYDKITFAVHQWYSKITKWGFS